MHKLDKLCQLGNIINFEYSENFPNSWFTSLIFPIGKVQGPLPKIAINPREKIFEIVDGRTPDHGHPISSPCEPNDSGELKKIQHILSVYSGLILV